MSLIQTVYSLRNMKHFLLLFLAAILMASCVTAPTSAVPDVFYILSTEVLHAYDEDRQEIYNARLTPEDTLSLYAEREYVREHYADGLPFYAPYYEQFTFAAISLSPDSFAIAYEHAKADITRQFRHYVQSENNGRPFVLMGFSQGAMLALDLLKEMPDSVFARCEAVYMMGYRLSAEDLAHERVELATDSVHGNVVSFNTVMRTDATWDFVANGAATCINPLNWCTDATPAILAFEGDTAKVMVDTLTHQLLVTGLDEEKYLFPLSSRGNLHHWDLLFYAEAIRNNILLRSNL